ncbi:hypothetical protein V3C99_001677 [Haemonchus contortus]
MPPSNSSEDDLERRVICGCAGLNRYFILILGLLQLSILGSSLIAFNASFVAMQDKTTSPLFNGSLTDDINWSSSALPIGDRRFSFSFLQKSLNFAGGFAGSIFGTIPLSMLLQRYGPHRTVTAIGISSTIMVAISPYVLCWSFPLFVLVRLIQGLGVAIHFPVIGCIVNEWAAMNQRGLFVAVLSAYVELCALITMPLGGLIAVKVNWATVYYLHAIACGFLTILWALYYRDKASTHPFVPDIELRRITYGKEPVEGNLRPPFRKIFRSPVIWAIWLAVIGNFLVANFLISYSPLYFSYVLKFPTITGAFLTMIPLGAQLVIKLVTGLASDRLYCLSELSRLRLFSSLSLLGSGLFFIILALFSPTDNIADIILIMIPIILVAFTAGGYPKCAVMVSRQYTPFVMSIVQIVAGCSLFCGAFLVPALAPMTPQDTFHDWRNVFLSYAIVLTLTNTIFVIFARSEPAKWTFRTYRVKPLRTSTLSASNNDKSTDSSKDNTVTTKTETDQNLQSLQVCAGNENV